MSLNKISVKVGGPAGEGVFTIGLLLAKYFQRLGLNVVYTTDYPSLIKGGHNTCCVRAEDEEIYAEMKRHDVLVALDDLTIKEDLQFLNSNGILVCSDKAKVDTGSFTVIRVPYDDLTKEIGAMYKNTIAFGAVVGLMSHELEKMNIAIDTHFGKKSDEVVEMNHKAAKMGYDVSKGACEKEGKCFLERISGYDNPLGKTVLMTGNDAAAVASIKAGVKFVGEYPMTPSSSFLSFMASHELDYHVTTKHTEDEIAAINMVIGASAAGVRAMTATSGGGFALMNEAIGFAGIAENPCVIFECMRGGPSTGLPTYTDQGDLKHVINASQGEFPIIVVAPGDIDEAFYESFNAFNLAEICQTPVVVLLDKHLAASQSTAKRFDTSTLKIDRGKYVPLGEQRVENYKRYLFTDDGISPRACLGQPGAVHVNSSYEHDETGFTSEDPQIHERMMEKRFKKLDSIPKDWLKPKLYGPEDADLTLVGWGSSKGPILEALKYLNRDGHKVNYMHFLYINPMDARTTEEMLKNCKDTMILECNYTGQLRDIIREKTGYNIEKTYLKYDSRPFFFEDIYTKVMEVLKK